jgi:hypothetical protein
MATSQTSDRVSADLLADDPLKTEFAHESKSSSLYTLEGRKYE